MEDIKRIEAFSLYDFVLQIEEAAKAGYSSTDTNEGMPQSYGPGLYTATMVIDKVDEVTSEPARPARPTPAKPVRHGTKSRSKQV
jgi:hypothetical protein